MQASRGDPDEKGMRHQKSGRRLNRDTDARKALMRNLCSSLLEHGRITTTEAKAKELRRWAERLITTARDGSLASRRQVAAEISQPEVVEKLFSNLVPRLGERPGGYTRIIRKGPRLGDAAPMVVIELVD
jgi:large subunit ribosomal protein L17